MEANYEERNKAQIIRVDARDCFVESKSDSFGIGKAHLEFATYDTRKPAGQRQTNHIHIYVDIAEFLCLAQEALSGMLHARARQMKANKDTTPLYQSLGGTSAEKLKQYGRSRPDGKSLSRTVKLLYGNKEDSYLFVADSGPGDTDAKGLIVPRFGNTPENHVAVSMPWRSVNEIMMMTKVHYEAWLAAKYMAENGAGNIKPPVPGQDAVRQTQKAPPPQNQVQRQAATGQATGRPDTAVDESLTASAFWRCSSSSRRRRRFQAT